MGRVYSHVYAYHSSPVEVTGKLKGISSYHPPDWERVSLVSAAVLQTPSHWPMSFQAILLSLCPTSLEECWDSMSFKDFYLPNYLHGPKVECFALLMTFYLIWALEIKTGASC